MSWILLAILVSIFLLALLCIYFVRQPYSTYKQVSQKGYRKITVWEGAAEVPVEVPYLMTDEEYNVDLSVVVPCYNEANRFPPNFTETYEYLADLKKRENVRSEIVLVNDGSRDATWDMIKDYCKVHSQSSSVTVKGVSVMPNSGKGNAVRAGFLYSKGENILMIDADGATKISDYERLNSRLNDVAPKGSHGIAIGSRRAKGEGATTTIERTFIRNLVSRVFNLITKTLVGLNVEDTQCGFKLFRRRSARIVSIQHLERWSFDCELLYIAAKKGYPVVEVAVTWHEVPGDSKISVIKDSLKMFRDIIAIRLLYVLRLWSFEDKLIR